MSTTPPGWYDDGHGALRWWDGAAWTEHVAQPDPEPAPGDASADASDDVLPPELAAELDPAAATSVGMPSPAEMPDYAAYGAGASTGAVPPYAPGPGGAFVSATEPTKSRAWIIWAVIGVVLLGIVIAAAVLIPLLILSATSTSGSAAPSDMSTVEIADSVALDDADIRAAVDSVALYDSAWQNVDCDQYVAATSSDFRETRGYADCESFVSEANVTLDAVDDYVVHVDAATEDTGAILVATTETYTSMYGEDGRLSADRVTYEDSIYYLLVSAGGEWLIDDVEYE